MPVYCLDARAATPHFPGIGRYVNNLLAELPGLLHSDEQLACLYEDHQSIHPTNRPTNQLIPQPPSSSLPSPFSITQQWKLPQRLRRLGASLYHSPYYLMPYRPGLPTVLTVYDLIPVLFPEMVSPRAARLFRLTTALALRAADRVIAISESARQDYIRTFHVPAEKILTIPLAVDASFYPRLAEEIAEVRQRYKLPGPYALYVGINKPHKNLVRLIEAWAQLPKVFPTLVIGGGWDPNYPEAKTKVERLGLEKEVCFIGPLDESDLPALYSGAEFFIFPSLYEGFGLPVLEALACGTPVACARTSSLPEVAGEAALYFDPLEIGEIAGAALRIAGDDELRRQLRRRGLAQAKKFTWQRTAEETCQVYRSLP